MTPAESRSPGDRYDTAFFGHPRGLATLFFTEMWERFSFYGMRALLILYMTAAVTDGGLAFDTAKAGAIYALYTSSVYLLGLPGGWLADRLLGQRRSILAGGIIIAAGHFSMAVPLRATFFLGLILIVLGTGLLKPNISSVVGQLYHADDERRDAGFSIFYMGINIGAFVAPIVCGWLGERVDWHIGFGAAGVGMVLGLVQYVHGFRYLGEAGLPPPPGEARERAARGLRNGVVAMLALVGVIVALNATGAIAITATGLSDSFGLILLVLTAAFFTWLLTRPYWDPVERRRLAAIVVLFVAASFFWGAYEQAGSSLNLFARDQTNRMVFGAEFPASWFQWVPALFVIMQAPVFAWLWVRLDRRQPSSPAKFSLGLLFVGLGFVVMAVAAARTQGGALVGPAWLLATYFLHVIGEMCLSPVGLSTVTRLAPERVTSLMMGVWFLASAVGNYVGGRTAGLYETLPVWQLFGIVAATTIAGAAVLALFIRPIRRLMGGVH